MHPWPVGHASKMATCTRWRPRVASARRGSAPWGSGSLLQEEGGGCRPGLRCHAMCVGKVEAAEAELSENVKRINPYFSSFTSVIVTLVYT